MTYTQADQIEKSILIQRLVGADLLVELSKYVSLMIYSSQTYAFIEEALLQLSIAQGDPDTRTDAGSAYTGLCVWSREQCIEEAAGDRKSLRALSEFSGDPDDRELYKLIDKIFIN